MIKPSAIIYVDGFNLYRRALINTPYKWLDLPKFLDSLLQEYEIKQIKYFTARITPKPHDKSAHIKQNTYIRALETDSRIQIHYGKFQNQDKMMPVAPWEYDEFGQPIKRRVRVQQEKGSDVNLATNLVFDVLKERADTYLIVTNDSDQVGPLKKLSAETNALLGLVLTSPEPANELLSIGLPIVRKIREGLLESSQFPIEIKDAIGKFKKPESW
ncbi:MAG: NYN domain-containing protein [Actinobacteria bacterium]|nr:NYN domain-containing protein [Actinomycetota bacterium]